ncbi:MAG: adenylyltransferase/cytidyltransferase family protein [Gammaproteobacteria bacterium]|nr:adenylyltransferase/cytidyltransferase family protein [Gammaproteobacteria bacterium]
MKNKKHSNGIIAGNFDIIHPGYILLFNECKENCDHLILLLHEDPSIERPEKLKPILSLDERILILSSLKQIDEIVPYKLESDLLNLIQNMNIDIRFLGDDYYNKEFTGKNLNIPIHFMNRSHGWSTTKYKQLISDTIKD